MTLSNNICRHIFVFNLLALQRLWQMCPIDNEHARDDLVSDKCRHFVGIGHLYSRHDCRNKSHDNICADKNACPGPLHQI